MLCLVCRRRPDVCTAQTRARDLFQIVVADTARPVQPKDQRILALVVVIGRNKEAIRHVLVCTSLKAVDRLLRGYGTGTEKSKEQMQHALKVYARGSPIRDFGSRIRDAGFVQFRNYHCYD